MLRGPYLPDSNSRLQHPKHQFYVAESRTDIVASLSKLARPLQELPPSPPCDSSHPSQDNPIIETLATKLAQSVSLVKSLTIKHHKAVAQNAEFHTALQAMRIENDDLKIENADLRDRVSLLESIMTFEEPKGDLHDFAEFKSQQSKVGKSIIENNDSKTVRSDWSGMSGVALS